MLRINRLCVITLLFGSSLAQQPKQPPSAQAPAPARKTAAETTRAPKVSADQKLALELLETGEAASRGFEAPMRSYGLLQVASSLATLDAPRARNLLRDSFTASLNIQDDDETKSVMQEEIFRTLLPLSQSDVEELLPQAEMKVRKPVTGIIVGRYAEKKDFEKAMELINQLSAVDEFPYGSAARLMDAMPAEMAAEKQTLFTQAVSSYKTHEHPGLMVGDETLTHLVNRFGLSMPPKLVIQGIEEILSRLKLTRSKRTISRYPAQAEPPALLPHISFNSLPFCPCCKSSMRAGLSNYSRKIRPCRPRCNSIPKG